MPRSSRPSRRSRRPLAVLLAAAIALLTACSGSSGDAAGTPGTGGTGSTGGTAGGDPRSGTPRTIVRFALDWTPNTNHTGLYVALQQGWFADAGLDVEVLPYNNAPPDVLVDSGAADFGISYQDSSILAQAGGADLVSVMAVLQHWATAIAVRADRDDITSPKDLDGKVYAGFGEPTEIPLLRTVIRDAGGTGDFTRVVLGTSAYEALYSGSADFTIPFLAWEGIEAQHQGRPLKTFSYTDSGFPDAYAVVIDANRGWLADHPDAARAFVSALQRGYAFAADQPDAAAQLLIDANPGVFSDESLVHESQAMLSAEQLRAPDGSVGTQTLPQWQGYGRFLFDTGLLVGVDGQPLTQEPDFATYFTDEYLAPAAPTAPAPSPAPTPAPTGG
jgi:ABC-type nitrate/sulfonate/bicarbonate transport system substrate-binding protein